MQIWPWSLLAKKKEGVMTIDNFTKALLILDEMQEQKHLTIKSYYNKNYNKPNFNHRYYEYLKQEYSRILELQNTLSTVFNIPMAIVACSHLEKALELIKNGVHLECFHLILPLVPNAKKRENAYYVDLIRKEKKNEK